MPSSTADTGPKGRPTYRAAPDAVTKWLRNGAVALTLLTGVALLASYPSLPNEIPTHFTFAGEADGWGPKSTIFILVAIFTVLTLGISWLSSRPQLLNYPFVITEDNAQACYREAVRMMVWLSVGISALYVAAAVGTITGISPGFLFAAVLTLTLGATAVGLVRTIRASS